MANVGTSTNGFSKGDTFHSGEAGIIDRVSADGTTVNTNWAVLVSDPNSPYYGPVVGLGMGGEAFSNQLVAVTFRATRGATAIWLVSSNGQVYLLATNGSAPVRPEGLIVVPNDSAKYGPFARTILYGDERLEEIYTVDTNGVLTNYDTSGWVPQGLHPESFVIIPTNQNLYIVNNSTIDAAQAGRVLKISSFALSGHIGDIAVPDELSTPPRLIILHWDATTSAFMPTTIPLPGEIDGISTDSSSFEGMTASRINVPNLRVP